MLARGAARCASSASAAASSSSSSAAAAAGAKVVPMSLCCHGNTYAFHYLNHPGVMAISTLLEMKGVVDMRANFTQENIEAIKEFDAELARKGQIALDHDLAVNFLDLEYIDETLPRLLIEKELSQQAQLDVLQRKQGDYSAVKSLESKKKDAVSAAMLKMPTVYKKKMLEDSLHVLETFLDSGPSVYKKKMLEDSLHVLETFLDSGYRNESDAVQALLYYCTLMESPDLELDVKQTKQITKKASECKAWCEKAYGLSKGSGGKKISQQEVEAKLKELKAACNPVVVEKLKGMIKAEG